MLKTIHIKQSWNQFYLDIRAYTSFILALLQGFKIENDKRRLREKSHFSLMHISGVSSEQINATSFKVVIFKQTHFPKSRITKNVCNSFMYGGYIV